MTTLTTGGVTTLSTFLTTTDTSGLTLGAARTIALGATSASTALTTTCRVISIICTGGTHCHYTVGVGAQTASSSSHYLKTGERIILAVPSGATVAAIQGTGSSTTLFITELVQ